MRKALVVGIDYYETLPALHGCTNDARSMKEVLEWHADGTVSYTAAINFGSGVKLLTGDGPHDTISRDKLKDWVEELFKSDGGIALFYFAGHGHIEATGGYICASDCRRGDDGLALAEVLTLANKCKAQNRVIVLDSC